MCAGVCVCGCGCFFITYKFLKPPAQDSFQATVLYAVGNEQDSRCTESLMQPTREYDAQSNSSVSESDDDYDITDSGPEDADGTQYESLYDLVEAKSKLSLASGSMPDIEKPTCSSTKKMKTKFGVLINQTTKSLKLRGVSADQLILFLAQLEGLDPVCTTAAESYLLFEQDIIKIFKAECSTIEDVFMRLKGYYSWFNYQLIKDIANVFCEDDVQLKKEFKKYKSHLSKYCEKRLHYFPEETEPPTVDTQIYIFKIEQEWRTMTLSQVKIVKKIICQILKLQKVALRLRSVRNGCVEMTFDIPTHLAEVVFPLSEEKVRVLKKHKIRYFPGEYILYCYTQHNPFCPSLYRLV